MNSTDSEINNNKRNQENSDNKIENESIDLNKVKACVNKVHFDGVGRTKEDVLEYAVSGLLKANNFRDIVVEAHQTKSFLESNGIFKDVGIFIDTSKVENSPSDYEVTFHVMESKRLSGGVHTMIGNNSGSMNVVATSPNLFGRVEKLQAEYSRGTQNSTNCNLTLTKPFFHKYLNRLTSAVFQESTDLTWSGIKQLDRGLLFELAFSSMKNLTHRLRCEGIWREISCLNYDIGFRTREEMGHALKCALKHSMTYDTRNETILPSDGIAIKLNQELAGFPGNLSFNKHELELQFNKSLPVLPDTSIQASFFGGLMNSTDQFGLITDRFFLGGPLSVRGFSTNGMGPISNGYALGSNQYWAAALHLFMPLPFCPSRYGLGNFLRTHLFINAGDIDNNLFSRILKNNLQDFSKTVRYAFGAGIILRIGSSARFELNYCVPMKLEPNDRLVSGLQFGVGISFL